MQYLPSACPAVVAGLDQGAFHNLPQFVGYYGVFSFFRWYSIILSLLADAALGLSFCTISLKTK